MDGQEETYCLGKLKDILKQKKQAKLKYIGMHTWINKITLKCR